MYKIILLLLVSNTYAVVPSAHQLNVKSIWGNCPVKSTSQLSLLLTKQFETEKSLKALKERILKDKLEEKYFLSSYKVQFNPLLNKLSFQYDCPNPIMKVNVYKDNSLNYYTTVLADNGKLYDPSFELLMKSEGILKKELPHMAVPLNAIEKIDSGSITNTLKSLNEFLKDRLSEVILNNKGDLTVILSINNHTSTAYFGNDDWKMKFRKLTKIVKYFEDKQKIPTSLNLTNPKKIVVKFSESI
jgi:hypothetical protein